MKTTATLPFQEEKKHSVLYGYHWQNPVKPKNLPVDNIYVKKIAFADGEEYPEKITITIET